MGYKSAIYRWKALVEMNLNPVSNLTWGAPRGGQGGLQVIGFGGLQATPPMRYDADF